ncbi:hypothetical protein C8R44DRAFT_725971 [Mycena epipterygia]|nr:hypothetical protein C8R44DRAFT_725971 [Mycena epipterygia]
MFTVAALADGATSAVLCVFVEANCKKGAESCQYNAECCGGWCEWDRDDKRFLPDLGCHVEAEKSKVAPTTIYQYLTYIEELIEGAGGGLDNLTTLVVDHIRLTRAKVQGTQICRYRDGSDYAVRLINSGNVTLAVPIIDICFGTLSWEEEENTLGDAGRPPFLAATVRNGLLDVIPLTCCANVDVPMVRDMLRRGLSGSIMHYSVLREMRNCTRSVVPPSSMYEDWNNLISLVEDRITVLDRAAVGGVSNTTAVRRYANVPTGAQEAIAKHVRPRPRKNNARNQVIPLTAPHYNKHDLLGHVSIWDRNYKRVLLHRDYLSFKHQILVLQIQFIVAHPDEPFYIGPWGITDNPSNAQRWARAERSGGRLVLHRAVTGSNGIAYLDEAEKDDVAELEPWLMTQVATLDTEIEAILGCRTTKFEMDADLRGVVSAAVSGQPWCRFRFPRRGIAVKLKLTDLENISPIDLATSTGNIEKPRTFKPGNRTGWIHMKTQLDVMHEAQATQVAIETYNVDLSPVPPTAQYPISAFLMDGKVAVLTNDERIHEEGNSQFLKFATLSARSLADIANSKHVPFLQPIATLSLLLCDGLNSTKGNKAICLRIIELVHQVHRNSDHDCGVFEVARDLNSPFIHLIIQDAPEDQRLLCSQQDLGRIKRFFKQSEIAIQLEQCEIEVQEALNSLNLKNSVDVSIALAEAEIHAQQRHQELLALLETHNVSQYSVSLGGSLHDRSSISGPTLATPRKQPMGSQNFGLHFLESLSL